MSTTTHHTVVSASGDTGVDEGAPGTAVVVGPGRRGKVAALWDGFCAGVGVALGLLPHLLHHVSLFAGAVLVTGAGGNLLFAFLGLLLSVPLLRRLYRRFDSWKAPAAALVAFTVLFSLSTFLIGPALAGADDSAPVAPMAPADAPPSADDSNSADHGAHHGK